MTVTVRIFTHSSLMPAPVAPGNKRYTTDSIGQLKQPYMARETLLVSGPAVASSVNTAPRGTNLLFVQVQAAKTINYEITPSGQTLKNADQNSPVLSGDTIFEFGQGWQISVVENLDA